MKDFNDCTKSQKIERYENVIRVLRGLTRHQRKKHWDMALFLEKNSCGTVGCAAGFCSLDPWFKRREFKSELDRRLDDYQFRGEDAGNFFGGGWWSILNNRTRRPVGTVIREIKAHIKWLRRE